VPVGMREFWRIVTSLDDPFFRKKAGNTTLK
jgi:hypothetical protein